MAKRRVGTLRKAFGMNVRVARVRRSMTQEDLAALVGTSQASLSEIERGLTAPNLDTVERLARALSVPVAYLMDEAAESSSS